MSEAVLSSGYTWKARGREYLLDPLFYVQAVVILLLCVMIVYPAVIIFNVSFRSDAGDLTLEWYRQAYTNPRNYGAIWNTAIIAASAALIAAVSGTFLAWCVVRTD